MGNYTAWFKNGELHREGDLPAVIDIEGKIKEWYTNGKLILRQVK
jgi:antitoxin component YwqK of YwqJK toxin-antitoxin module